VKKRNYLWSSQSQWEVKTVLSSKLAFVKLTIWQTRDIFLFKTVEGLSLKVVSFLKAYDIYVSHPVLII